MNKKSVRSMLAMTVILIFAVGTAVQAGEIIYRNDISDQVVNKEVVVKTGENVIVMVDSSASMAAENKTFHKSYYVLEKEALKAGFERMPDLGYTDDTGKPEYNLELSRRRAEAAADYLQKTYNLGSDRVVANWYGAKNAIDSNKTTEGQAKNRRVELSIGGM